MQQTMSAAAQVIIAVIPIVGIVMGSVVIFFYLLWNHKRRILLIEAGQYNPPKFDFLSFSLMAGILLTAVGITLTVFLYLVLQINYGLLGGLIPLCCGISLLAWYAIKRSSKTP